MSLMHHAKGWNYGNGLHNYFTRLKPMQGTTLIGPQSGLLRLLKEQEQLTYKLPSISIWQDQLQIQLQVCGFFSR